MGDTYVALCRMQSITGLNEKTRRLPNESKHAIFLKQAVFISCIVPGHLFRCSGTSHLER